MAVKGLLPQGKTTGHISASTSDDIRTNPSGVVLQNPDVQLFRPTIGTETAFGLENNGVPPEAMSQTVKESLESLGIDNPLSTKVATLSMGQKYRLIMAGILAMGHQLLLLDEPGAQLDPKGIAQLKKWLQQLKDQQIGMLISEHHPEEFTDLVDAYWSLDPAGGLRSISAPAKIDGPPAPTESTSHPTMIREETISANNLSPPKDMDVSIWSSLDVTVGRGERVAIFGANGSGKSTLVGCLIGFLTPRNGHLSVWGQTPKPGLLRGRIGYLSQAPHKQLFEATVEEELTFSLKRFGNNPEETKERVAQTLEEVGIPHLAQASPHKLSFGQQHLVALASVLVYSPELLILDDPFAGLDQQLQTKIQTLLSTLNQENETTIVWTSHRPQDLKNWANKTITLSSNDHHRNKTPQMAEPNPKGNAKTAAGWKLAACVLLSCGAFAARTPQLLGIVFLANLMAFFFFRSRLSMLRGAGRILVIQTLVITTLHCLRFGVAEGLQPGLTTSLQLFLAFFPSAIFISTTPQSQMIGAMELIMPSRAAFVAGTCLAFLPTLVRELISIYQAQILRGARILPKDLVRPQHWPDVASCLLVPAVIHCMVRAKQIATAAQARDYGITLKRTLWQGD